MYFKYVYFMLIILQIHLHLHVLINITCNCTFGILIWYTSSLLNCNNKFVMHFKCAILFKDHTILINTDNKTHFRLNIKKYALCTCTSK